MNLGLLVAGRGGTSQANIVVAKIGSYVLICDLHQFVIFSLQHVILLVS